MKAYTQFLKELPSKKVVFAFGRFQPPTIGHELLVKAVEKLAKQQNADHVIYASHTQDKKTNPLPVDRKVYYLKRLFPEANVKAAGGTTRTFIEVAKELNKRYKNLVMVAGSDRVAEYKKILEKYNGTEFKFDTISVVSAGERDPDSDSASGMSGTKMREAAKKGDFELFKRGLPHTLTTVDAKRLMNEIRDGMGLGSIKEEIKFARDWLRESYFRGEIYKVGQFVESNGQKYEILDRGSNYVTVVDSNGSTHRKWITDVTICEDYVPADASDIIDDKSDLQITYKGYRTKHFDVMPDASVAFAKLINKEDIDAVAVLNAIKSTDEYLKLLQIISNTDAIDEKQHHDFDTYVQKAQEYLMNAKDLHHHVDYINSAIHKLNQVQAQYHAEKDEQMEESMKTFKELMEMKFTASDKIKVARIIADALGVPDVEKSSNAEQLLNNALRKVRNKPLRAENIAIIKNMLQTAKEAGIEYDEKLVPQKVEEETINEISPEAHARYRVKARSDIKSLTRHVNGEYGDIAKNIVDRRIKGLTTSSKLELKKKLSKEEASPMIKPPTNRFDDKKSAFAHAKQHGGKVYRREYINPRTGMKDTHFVVKEDTNLEEQHIVHVSDGSKYGDKPHKKDVEHVESGAKKHGGQYDGASDKGAYFKFKTRDAAKNFKKHVDSAPHKSVYADIHEEIELDEATPYYNKPSFLKKMSRVAKQERQAREKKEQDQKKQVKEEYNEEPCPVCGKSPCECDKPVVGDTGKLSYEAMKRFLGLQDVHDLKPNELKSVGIPISPSELIVKHHRMHEEAELEKDEEEDFDDSEFDDDINSMENVDDVIDAYDDDELAIVDDESGEELESDEEDEDEKEKVTETIYRDGKLVILEISRMERIRRKQRFARTKSKREVRAKIALRRSSNQATINKRARRLAISLIKKRLLRKNPSKASLPERERVEKFIQSRKAVIDRLARRVAPRIRQIEKARLHHKKFTKGRSPNDTI